MKSTERGKDGYMDEVPEGAPGRFAQHCSALSRLEFALCVRWLLSHNVLGLPTDCFVLNLSKARQTDTSSFRRRAADHARPQRDVLLRR